MLDAGAGYELPLDIPLATELVGVDLSPEALEKNANVDEKIVGDIQELDADRLGTFDAVICWWVLEHVPRPADAIRSFADVLRVGGLLVVAVPYFWGFKGLATKLTPHSFHVRLARRANPDAGKPGNAPYRTFMRQDIAPARIDATCRENGLEAVHRQLYAGNPEQRLPPAARPIWRAAGRVTRAMTLGRYDPLVSEYFAIYHRIADVPCGDGVKGHD